MDVARRDPGACSPGSDRSSVIDSTTVFTVRSDVKEFGAGGEDFGGGPAHANLRWCPREEDEKRVLDLDRDAARQPEVDEARVDIIRWSLDCGTRVNQQMRNSFRKLSRGGYIEIKGTEFAVRPNEVGLNPMTLEFIQLAREPRMECMAQMIEAGVKVTEEETGAEPWPWDDIGPYSPLFRSWQTRLIVSALVRRDIRRQSTNAIKLGYALRGKLLKGPLGDADRAVGEPPSKRRRCVT